MSLLSLQSQQFVFSCLALKVLRANSNNNIGRKETGHLDIFSVNKQIFMTTANADF